MAKSYVGKYKDQDCSFLHDDLVALLKEDPIPGVRAATASVLPLFSKERAIGPLKEALKDESPLVRLDAAIAMAQAGNGDDMAALKVLSKVATNETLKAMGKTDFLESGVCPGNLDVSGKSSVDPVERTRLSWRLRAVKGLKKSKTQYAKTVLVSLRKDKDARISKAAAE